MTRSELLFKIMLLTMNQPHFVATLSIFDFLAYGGCKTVVGFGAQTVGYAAAAIGDRGNVIDCLPPLLTHGPQAIQFIATAATLQEKQNRVATLAFTLAGTGCLSLAGDVVANAGAGGFIYYLSFDTVYFKYCSIFWWWWSYTICKSSFSSSSQKA